MWFQLGSMKLLILFKFNCNLFVGIVLKGDICFGEFFIYFQSWSLLVMQFKCMIYVDEYLLWMMESFFGNIIYFIYMKREVKQICDRLFVQWIGFLFFFFLREFGEVVIFVQERFL